MVHGYRCLRVVFHICISIYCHQQMLANWIEERVLLFCWIINYPLDLKIYHGCGFWFKFFNIRTELQLNSQNQIVNEVGEAILWERTYLSSWTMPAYNLDQCGCDETWRGLVYNELTGTDWHDSSKPFSWSRIFSSVPRDFKPRIEQIELDSVPHSTLTSLIKSIWIFDSSSILIFSFYYSTTPSLEENVSKCSLLQQLHNYRYSEKCLRNWALDNCWLLGKKYTWIQNIWVLSWSNVNKQTNLTWRKIAAICFWVEWAEP